MSKTVIQKLIKKATTIIYSGPGEIEEFDKEKFAELLIQECQSRVEQYISDCGEIGSLPDSVIIEHFGLK